MSEKFEDDFSSNIYIVMWHEGGLEAIVDARDLDAADTMNRLMGEAANTFRTTLNYMVMRARFNSQRHYELFSIHTSKDVSLEDLTSLFEEDPQSAVDLIRERGTMLYSDRQSDRVIIR